MLNPPGDIVEYVMEPRQTNDKELCRDNMTLEQAGYEICDEEIIPVISTDFGANCRVELSKICRCCLARKNDLQSIFDTNSCIPEMIMSLATVEVSFFFFGIFTFSTLKRLFYRFHRLKHRCQQIFACNAFYKYLVPFHISN